MAQVDAKDFTAVSPVLYTYLLANNRSFLNSMSNHVRLTALVHMDPVDRAVLSVVLDISMEEAGTLVGFLNDIPTEDRVDFALFYAQITPEERGRIGALSQEERKNFLPLLGDLERRFWLAALEERLQWHQAMVTLKKYNAPSSALYMPERAADISRALSRATALVLLWDGAQEDLSRVERLVYYVEDEGGGAQERKQALLDLATIINAFGSRTQAMHYSNGVLPFKDTTVGDWYTDYVRKAKNRNILSGYRDGNGQLTGVFGAGDPVTQCEALKLALESAGIGPLEGAPQSPNAQGHWCAGYVHRAEVMGMHIAQDIAPDMPATRAQVVRVMLEAMGIELPIYNAWYFSDVAGSSAKGYIQFAYEQGIVSGKNNTNVFGPTEPITRAATAKIVHNVLEILVDPVKDKHFEEAIKKELEHVGVISYKGLLGE